VRKLPPATVRVVECDGRSRDRVCWRPDYVRDPDRADMDRHDGREAVDAALRTAVERRMAIGMPAGSDVRHSAKTTTLLS
jgi:asparagine synthase (glutamine-hydrolysing)